MSELCEPPVRIDDLARAVIGAAIDVHRNIGPGFLESIYETAMADELSRRELGFERQVVIPVEFKGRIVGEHRLDLLVGGELVLELKSVDAIVPIHVAQVVSYLKAGAFQLGLLINFNVPVLRQGIRRVINSG